jgi:hypothetical protein
MYTKSLSYRSSGGRGVWSVVYSQWLSGDRVEKLKFFYLDYDLPVK